jgi:Ricin-type beta-trefoil lectin domain-like
VKFIDRLRQFVWCAVCLLVVSCTNNLGLTDSQGVEMVAAATYLVTYPQPSGIAASDKCSVKVNGVSSFTYKSNASGRISGSPDTASWTTFAFSGGAVTVEVTKLDVTSVGSVVVRPLDENITATVTGNTATFVLTKPGKFSVEFDGNLIHKCFVFADAPETNVPSQSDPSVMYFGPGVHNLGKDANLPLGKNSIYIAGGAYVRGSFKFDMNGRTSNVNVSGRGIISGEFIPGADLDSMFKITDSRTGTYVSQSVIFDGITILDAFSFNIDLWKISNTPGNPNVINNVKEIGWAYHTDGYHSTGYINVNDMFIFNSDDALDVGQFMKGGTITNCVLWQNRSGASLLFGWVGNETTGNVTVKNIDIIHYSLDSFWPNSFAFMANFGDSGHIQNIWIDDVRLEDFSGSNNRFLGLQLAKSAWSDPNVPYGNISDLHFTNIRIDEPTSGNVIFGQDWDHRIYNVAFENLKIAGQLMTSLTAANIATNSFVSNITLSPVQIGRPYIIESKKSGKAMTVANASMSNGGNVVQQTYTGGNHQKWVFEDAGEGWYTVKAYHSGLVLDVYGLSMQNGGNINQWTFANNNAQKWRLMDVGGGYFEIISRNSSKSVDVYGGSLDEGGNIVQWDYVGFDNQKWKLIVQ